MHEPRRQMRVSRSTDRISSLPEDIIHEHIFCHLSDIDIKRMSCLSKTWYQLSNSFPILVLSKLRDDEDTIRENSKQSTHDKYLNYIDRTLHRFHKDDQIIRRVGIYLEFRYNRAQLVDTWINLVLRHRFEEFNLCLTTPKTPFTPSTPFNKRCLCSPSYSPYYSPYDSLYDLPPSVFSHPNSVIKVARFRGCSLHHSFRHSNPIPNMLMLKKLSLNLVAMNETSVSSLISCCPLIEHLSIVDCTYIIYSLRISQLHKLKHLTIVCSEEYQSYIEHYVSVEIEAPSLETLDITDNTGSLLPVNIIGHYPILTDLALRNIQRVELPDISSFPLLRSLCLFHIFWWINLNLVSNTLKFDIMGENVSKNIDVPNLQSLVYSGPFSQWYTVISYSIHHEQTLKAIGDSLVKFSDSKMENVQMFEPIGDSLVDFSNFLSKMKNVEHLDLHFQCDWKLERYFTFEEVKPRLVQSPGFNIGNLNLFFGDKMKNYHWTVLNVIDAILWTCHPRIISIKLYGLEFIAEDVVRYMCSFSTRSWYKYVRNVMYVTEDGTKYTTSTINCVQLLKVLSTGFGDSTWPVQSKSDRHAGEVRLMMHYTDFNSEKPSKQTPSAPPHGAVHTPQASMYFTPPPPYAPPPSALLYPPASAYPPPPSAFPPPPSTYPPAAAPYAPPTSAPHYPPVSPYPPASAYPPPASVYPPPSSAYPSYPPRSAPYPPNPYIAPSSYPTTSYEAPSAYPPQPQCSPYYPPGPYFGAYPPPPY